MTRASLHKHADSPLSRRRCRLITTTEQGRQGDRAAMLAARRRPDKPEKRSPDKPRLKKPPENYRFSQRRAGCGWQSPAVWHAA